jgi:hypothetical protein
MRPITGRSSGSSRLRNRTPKLPCKFANTRRPSVHRGVHTIYLRTHSAVNLVRGVLPGARLAPRRPGETGRSGASGPACVPVASELKNLGAELLRCLLQAGQVERVLLLDRSVGRSLAQRNALSGAREAGIADRWFQEAAQYQMQILLPSTRSGDPGSVSAMPSAIRCALHAAAAASSTSSSGAVAVSRSSSM